MSTSHAGMTVNDQSMQKMIPTAVNRPNARTGAMGERAKERNPMAVVIDVFTTGGAISVIVSDTMAT